MNAVARKPAPVLLNVKRVTAVVVAPAHPLDGLRVEVTGRGRGGDVFVVCAASNHEYTLNHNQLVDEVKS